MNNRQSPYPLGAHYEKGKIRFAFASVHENCGVLLYDRKTGALLDKRPFRVKDRIGNIYGSCMKLANPNAVTYQFYEEDKVIPDAYARAFSDRGVYGRACRPEELKAVIYTDRYDWGEDVNPRIPYENCLCYCLHVRGFTAHKSSKAAARGTFAGLMEKLPYLKETGITTLEFQPLYEFVEHPVAQEEELFLQPNQESKLNYWGYTKGYYYAPKGSYSACQDAVRECKDMIRSLHKNGMEAVLQFYFDRNTTGREILDILRFWVLEYHVDGFHLMGADLPVQDLARDPMLADTKLWYYSFDGIGIKDKEAWSHLARLAVYEDSYLFDMRKYLKGDEDMVAKVLYQMRHIPEGTGRIHFLSNYYGLTLMDTFSYDRKHNEANGEDNRDGGDYNCSWNCGEEGATRKKRIQRLRKQLYKNALCMLFFTSSTPLIFMGDEFGNSQGGNNNPYCQDNDTTWLNWRDLDKNRELYTFFCSLARLRREHPVLRPQAEPRVMDYISCGYPDLSYHGQNAWRPQLESYSRQVGMMYCGKYARTGNRRTDDFFYVAMNMHWEPHELALPRLPKDLKWQLSIHTDMSGAQTGTETKGEGEKELLPALAGQEPVKQVAPRSICIFTSVKA
ncbi:MAG: alpha-amylase family glycosyl hydrolase [Roseburia sp.]|nr:alpha-amylase family glycosyl hydrolase [Roseburia sp.]